MPQSLLPVHRVLLQNDNNTAKIPDVDGNLSSVQSVVPSDDEAFL